MPKKYRVKLIPKQRELLEELTSKGTMKVRAYKRAQILLLADEAQPGCPKSDEQIAEQVNISTATVQRVRQRFVENGLDGALTEKPRSGAPPKITSRQRARITSLACSDPPAGYARWSLRLLATKLVELELVDQISHDSVGRVLKKTNLSLTSNDTGVSDV
jgi:transposase